MNVHMHFCTLYDDIHVISHINIVLQPALCFRDIDFDLSL